MNINMNGQSTNNDPSLIIQNDNANRPDVGALNMWHVLVSIGAGWLSHHFYPNTVLVPILIFVVVLVLLSNFNNILFAILKKRKP